MGQYGFTYRINQRGRRTENLPQLRALRYWRCVQLVARTGNHSAIAQSHNPGRPVLAARFHHQRFGQERLNYGRRNRRDADFELLNVLTRHQFDRAGIERWRTTALVQRQHLTGVDQLRVFHLVLIELPQLTPAIGVFEELTGKTPQRIARHHDITIWRTGSQFQWFRRRCGDYGRAENADE